MCYMGETDADPLHGQPSDLCPLSPEKAIGGTSSKGWLKCCYDSGCGQTVFPKLADYGVSSRAATPKKFITASGEEIASVDEYRVDGVDDFGLKVNMKGRLTDVRKPRVSVGGVEDKRHDAFISEN